MTTGIGSLIDISRRSLGIQSQSIGVIGNNISNVNNPNYSRRVTNLVSDASSGAYGIVYGSGVSISSVSQVIDNYLVKNYRSCLSELSLGQIQSDYLQRAEAFFSLDTTKGRIGVELAKFFSSLEDLQADPSSQSYRLGVINQGQSVASLLSSTYDNIAQLQREVDDRISGVVSDINRITRGIASLNDQISRFETSGQEALSLRDQRDALMKELSTKISFNVTTQQDGAVNIVLANGFGLVTGFTSNDLKCTASPSFLDGKLNPTALDGGSLNFVTFDYNKTGTGAAIDVNLTSLISSGSGELAGLLRLRGVQTLKDDDGINTVNAFDNVSGSLVETATYIEVMARDLLTRFNEAYQGDGTNVSGDLNGNPMTDIFGLFSFAGADVADMDGDGIPSLSDLIAYSQSAHKISFASMLQFNVTDASKLATATDLGGNTFAASDGSNIQRLLNQRNVKVQYSLGAVGVTATIGELYDTAVSRIGVMTKEQIDATTLANAKVLQAETAVASVSGVDLDEEFSKLILYQRAYQGSARLINTANELLGELIALLG